VKLRFAGFGGQGVVLCGYIIGKAAMRDGRNAIHTQSYGSASRGGLTRSDVGIADGEIHDLVFDELDLLVALSQQSYDAFRGDLRDGGLLFYETDMVALADEPQTRTFGIAATDIAFKEFGRKIMANMIMIGFVNETAQLVSSEALAETIAETVPAGTAAANIEAFTAGRQLARAAGAEGTTPSEDR
jgi:2-oxoglutarate ferredoxin oxidoreductase subunit gamma